MVTIKNVVLVASFLGFATATQAWEPNMFEVRDIFAEDKLNVRDLSDHELAYLSSRSGFETIVRRGSIKVSLGDTVNAAKDVGKTRKNVNSAVNNLKSRISPISHSLQGNAGQKYQQIMRSVDSSNKALNEALSSLEKLLSSSTKSLKNANKITSRF